MRIKRIVIFFALLLTANVGAQVSGYNSFENILPGGEASVVNCFVQDSQGLMWLGTGAGLCSYDGYHVQGRWSAGDSTATRIYCGLMFDDRVLFTGSDRGVHLYDTHADTYINKGVRFPCDVRAMMSRDGVVWVGTLNGFYSYEPVMNRLTAECSGKLPHPAVYSLAGHGGSIYIGTYNGLARFDPPTGVLENIPLPMKAGQSNSFVNSLLADPGDDYIWIGTEGGLFRYYPATGRIDAISCMRDNSVKSMAMDGRGNLIAGTDDGVYVFDPATGRSSHVVHDSRNNRSLANNIVWSVFRDRDDNLWLGTDDGISLVPNSELSRFVPISDITGIGDGNQFYSIFRDSRGYMWLGGANGLIRTDDRLSAETSRTVWYRMGDTRHPISHNRIRDIYEDSEGQLWVATDGSINLYDYGRGQFRRLNITDSTGTRNTNWAYGIFEDGEGYMWVSAYLGGVFRAERKALLASEGRTYIADRNWSSNDGLEGDAVNNMAADGSGRVWTQSYPTGINRIDIATGKVSSVRVSGGDESQPNYLKKDDDGNIWTGKPGWVTRINPADDCQDSIELGSAGGGVTSMDDSPGYMWVAASGGIYAIGKDSLDVHHIQTPDRNYTALWYDEPSGLMYVGTTDGLLLFSPETAILEPDRKQVIVTSLLVNNVLFEPTEKEGGGSIRRMSGIVLPFDRNNLGFTVSDLNYSSEKRSRFIYRLDGLENQWTAIADNGNRISYPNLRPGNYTLLVSTLGPDNRPAGVPYSLALKIRPPWFGSVTARIAYALFGLGLIMLIFISYRTRHNLRLERMRREQSLELSGLKMDFFTNISHEFKTPLSLILAPLGKLLVETRNEETRSQLELIQRNAMKLNTLTHQVLEFNRGENAPDEGVILSRVELVGFARSIFAGYAEGVNEKRLEFVFESSHERIFTDVDLIKTESILNNMLSNSCKYTGENGRVVLHVEGDEATGEVSLTVADTGVGIPEDELPYVFGRFFQSSATKDMKKGTGIGLYLVRHYAELQDGRAEIFSKEGRETIISVILPWRGERYSGQTAVTGAGDDAPLVLIVEDNAEIAGFLARICGASYRCETADNGRIGLDKCRELRPDLIISDVMMPVMDGLEMCRRIRGEVAISTIPIILLTAKDDVGTQLESMKLDVNAFIPKPFDADILLSRIAQLLKHSRQVEARVRIEAISEPSAIEAVSADEKFLARVTGLIESNVADPDLNVAMLSELSGFGQKQLYRKVKQLTGTTPVDYIRTIRLKKAAMLMEQGKFSVSEVMYMVGFSNQSYFAKCFQQEFGISPSRYLAKAAGKNNG